jgi:hypothetical protein
LFVAVPNLDALTSLYTNSSLTPPEKFFVMRMIYGGQVIVCLFARSDRQSMLEQAHAHFAMFDFEFSFNY